jgi:polyisoprenoid-binding protein YceI
MFKNYFFIKSLSLFSLFILLPSAKAMDSRFVLKKTNGVVRFLATGNPSAMKINGEGSGPEGQLVISNDDKSSVLNGNFSFDLNSLKTGIDMRDSHMKEKYLEVEKFPNASFSIDSLNISENILKNVEKKALAFSGKLNLHGKEHSIVGITDIKLDKDQLKIFAKFKIKSSDFSIEVPSFAGITVGDEISIEVDLTLPTVEKVVKL